MAQCAIVSRPDAATARQFKAIQAERRAADRRRAENAAAKKPVRVSMAAALRAAGL